MLNFDVKELCFKFDGKDYKISYPNVKLINNFRKDLAKKGSDEVESTIKFLETLGAKRTVIESLRIDQLNSLVDELTKDISSKKN